MADGRAVRPSLALCEFVCLLIKAVNQMLQLVCVCANKHPSSINARNTEEGQQSAVKEG